jgi:hypothetical protein
MPEKEEYPVYAGHRGAAMQDVEASPANSFPVVGTSGRKRNARETEQG